MLWLTVGSTLGGLLVTWWAHMPAETVLSEGVSAESDRLITWVPNLQAGLALAQASGKPALVRFQGPASPLSRRMETEVFPEPAVRSFVNEYFVAVSVNISIEPYAADRYGIRDVPVTLAMTPDGHDFLAQSGFLEAEGFRIWLEQAREAWQKRSR